MAKPPNIQGVGVPWFTTETWPRLLEVCGAEADLMPATFAEWIALAEPRFAQHAANGVPVERVLIDPDEWVEWCEANDLVIDGRARAAFAACCAGTSGTSALMTRSDAL